MNILGINWLALLVGTIVIITVNMIWFGPKTFYPVWWRAMGKEYVERDPSERSNEGMVAIFGGTFAGALAQSAVLTIMVQGASTQFEMNILFGALIGLGLGVLAAAASLGHRLFAMQGYKVWAIEVGADILALVIAGAVMALLV